MQKPSERSFWLTVASGLLLLLLSCGGLCTWGGATYSEGFRDGEVQKFSRKPWPCLSWEGELALAGFRLGKAHGDGSVWAFSLDESQADLIKEFGDIPIGETVRIHYRQVFLRNPFVYGTSYRVLKIERLKAGGK